FRLGGVGEDSETRGSPVGARGYEQHRRALRRPSPGRAAGGGQGVSQAVGALGREIRPSAGESGTAGGGKGKGRPPGDEGLGSDLVGVQQLAVPAGGRIVAKERPGQVLHHLLDEEHLWTVQEEERWDTPGRGVAEEGGDLQLRILRRRS